MRISILSCGWLGLPLATALQQSGYLVKGARTSAAGVELLQQSGIDGYIVQLSPEGISAPGTFWEADMLIINIPPRIQRGKEAHIAEMQLLADLISNTSIKQVIFVSSTSVYAATEGLITENDTAMPSAPGGQALRAVESLLMGNKGFNTTVLRFGGLIGYDRLPGPKRSAKLSDALTQPMNVIHRDDCIAIISKLVADPRPGEIYNACAGEHPLRYNYYQKAGVVLDPLPADAIIQGKMIDSGKLIKELPYTFKYNNPLQLL
jgi:nucleoside-diphosphate-sugar epimerase